MSPDDHMPGGMPEQTAETRYDRERGTRGQTRDACACGRAIVVRGKCAYCLHAENAK